MLCLVESHELLLYLLRDLLASGRLELDTLEAQVKREALQSLAACCTFHRQWRYREVVCLSRHDFALELNVLCPGPR